jgi:hypothetical protein
VKTVFSFEDESDRAVGREKGRRAFNGYFRKHYSQGRTLNEDRKLGRGPENDKEVTAGVNGPAAKNTVARNVSVTFADIASWGYQAFAWATGRTGVSGINCGSVLRLLIAFHEMLRKPRVARVRWSTLIGVTVVFEGHCTEMGLAIENSDERSTERFRSR